MFIKTILSLADTNKNNHLLRDSAQEVIIKINVRLMSIR